MIEKYFNLLYLFFFLLFIRIKAEDKIISSIGILGEYTQCQNMNAQSSVFTIYLKGNFTEMWNYVEDESCSFPLNTFSISSILSNETEVYPLYCSYINSKNISFYQVKCTLYNFKSDYVGPFRMTKISSVNSTSCKALEANDNYIINLKFDDNTIFGNTQKNILREPYLVGSNYGNKVIVNYSRTDNKIILSYVGEVTTDNLPKVESNGHFLNCEIDNSLKSWEVCYINKDEFPKDNVYTLNIYDQCNLLYNYHPNFYTTQNSNIKNLDLSKKLLAILIILLLS